MDGLNTSAAPFFGSPSVAPVSASGVGPEEAFPSLSIPSLTASTSASTSAQTAVLVADAPSSSLFPIGTMDPPHTHCMLPPHPPSELSAPPGYGIDAGMTDVDTLPGVTSSANNYVSKFGFATASGKDTSLVSALPTHAQPLLGEGTDSKDAAFPFSLGSMDLNTPSSSSLLQPAADSSHSNFFKSLSSYSTPGLVGAPATDSLGPLTNREGTGGHGFLDKSLSSWPGSTPTISVPDTSSSMEDLLSDSNPAFSVESFLNSLGDE